MDASEQTSASDAPVCPSPSPSPSTCPVCESTSIRSAAVRSAFWHDDRLVVVEDVPALVCSTCGEQFYDDAAVLMIDRMRGRGFPPEEAVRELRVPVFSFGNVVAEKSS